MKGRVEGKAKANKLLYFTFIHFPLILSYINSRFFFWDAVIEKPSGLRPSRGGLRPEMGRSQYVKIRGAESESESPGDVPTSQESETESESTTLCSNLCTEDYGTFCSNL